MDREVVITWGPNQNVVRLLSESGARFMVIGGTAVRFHIPERREPNDLDLLVEPSPDLLKKLNAALARVGAPTVLATPEAFAQPNKGFPEKSVCYMDVFTPIPGLNFAEHWALAEEAAMAYTSTRVRVASISTLVLWLRHALSIEPERAKGIEADLNLLEGAQQQRKP